MHLLGRWWLQMLVVAAFPAIFSVASHQVALLIPGTVSLLGWKLVVSWLFLACAVTVVVLAWRARAPRWQRASLAIGLVVPLAVTWVLVGSWSNWYDGPSHIGGSAR